MSSYVGNCVFAVYRASIVSV